MVQTGADNNDESRQINRRSALNTIGATGVGVLGSGSLFVASGSGKPIGGGGGGNPYWETADGNHRKVEVPGPGGPTRYGINSTLNLQNVYTCEKCPKFQYQFSSTSKALTRAKHNGDWGTTYAGRLRYGEIEWYEKGGDVALDFSTDKTRLGVRPSSVSDDSTYGSFVVSMLSIAMGQIHPALSAGISAASAVAKFVNQATAEEEFDKSGRKFKWEWSVNTAPTDVEFHCISNATFTEGKTGRFIVSNWTRGAEGFIDNSWEVYYDGSTTDPNDVHGSSINRGTSSPTAPVKQSPNPPENPEEWTYHPIPDHFQPQKVPVEELPETSSLRQEADKYVVKTAAPLWTRRIKPEKPKPNNS